MGDFSAESSIVHKKDIEILDVVDNEFLEAVRKMVSGLFI